jgi:NADH-quinone oxidoreductase subunit N
MIQNDLNLILPEILLSIFAMLALIFGVYRGQDKKTATLTLATAGLMLIVGMWMIFGGSSSEAAFNNMFISDAFSRYAKALILLSSAAVLIMSLGYMLRHDLGRFEYPILIIFSVVGMMFMVSANDLMVLYLGLELQSLALYVVASIRRYEVFCFGGIVVWFIVVRSVLDIWLFRINKLSVYNYIFGFWQC